MLLASPGQSLHPRHTLYVVVCVADMLLGVGSGTKGGGHGVVSTQTDRLNALPSANPQAAYHNARTGLPSAWWLDPTKALPLLPPASQGASMLVLYHCLHLLRAVLLSLELKYLQRATAPAML